MGPADERESIATIHAALDQGITLLDTGDYYGAGHNAQLACRRWDRIRFVARRLCIRSAICRLKLFT